jgi:hypothetical protein
VKQRGLVRIGVSAIFAGCAILSGCAASACPINRAVYSITGFEGGFRGVRSGPREMRGLVFFIHSLRRNRTFWFSPRTTGPDHIELTPIAIRDVRRRGLPARGANDSIVRSLDYLATDAAHRFLIAPPTRSSKAPAYILLPDLPEVMWYGVDDPREDAPLGFLRFSACRRRP